MPTDEAREARCKVRRQHFGWLRNGPEEGAQERTERRRSVGRARTPRKKKAPRLPIRWTAAMSTFRRTGLTLPDGRNATVKGSKAGWSLSKWVGDTKAGASPTHSKAFGLLRLSGFRCQDERVLAQTRSRVFGCLRLVYHG